MTRNNDTDDPPTEPTWTRFFGYDEPYTNQADAITAAITAGQQHGFLAMEGACGTGKTMAALTAAAHLIRTTRQYDTLLVVTPVKQQLDQFVADLRAMNRRLDEPLRGIALVGKADLCPYEREGVFPADASVHTRCESLREHTAELVSADAPGTPTTRLDTPAPPVPTADTQDPWWDPDRAATLVSEARLDADTHRSLSDTLETAGQTTPYPRHQPTAPADLTNRDPPPLFCPFEADWYARNKGSPVDFSAGTNHVLTPEDYLPASVRHGTCPHRAMSVLLEHADVVIGNYNHLFDPRTRPLTEAIIDDRTFVVIDEAHRLEERVRDLLSDTLGEITIRRARRDHETLLEHAGHTQQTRDRVRDTLREHDVTIPDVERAIGFYDDLLAWLDHYVETHLDAHHDHDHPSADAGRVTTELPLRDPDSSDPDDLTTWAATTGYPRPFLERLRDTGRAVEQTLDHLDPDRSCVAGATGSLLAGWVTRDHTTYFREIEVEHAPHPNPPQSASAADDMTVRLVMFNCLPGDAIADILDILGGGVLMSATLEPLSVFEEITGLDRLAGTPTTSRTARPVLNRSYPLPFPGANRASWIVDATPFTARNRGPPTHDNQNPVRQEYARILRVIANSHGNILLCLPNYNEAAWAATILETETPKPILLDEPTTAETTRALRESFAEGDHKVLVTSTRGTLTEGVDYAGDTLHTCAVIGIPLVNTASPRVQAVKHAYATAFGDTYAFEYALTVPAVRRARQAIGRVIRSPTDTGTRILVDHRYTPAAPYGSVHGYLPPDERDEFVRMTPMFLDPQLTEFWTDHT